MTSGLNVCARKTLGTNPNCSRSESKGPKSLNSGALTKGPNSLPQFPPEETLCSIGGIGVNRSTLNGFTGTWTSKQETTQSEGQAAATRAWVLGIGGAALVAAGATMFVIGGREATHGVAVAPLPGGAAVAWGTSF